MRVRGLKLKMLDIRLLDHIRHLSGALNLGEDGGIMSSGGRTMRVRGLKRFRSVTRGSFYVAPHAVD